MVVGGVRECFPRPEWNLGPLGYEARVFQLLPFDLVEANAEQQVPIGPKPKCWAYRMYTRELLWVF